MAEPHVTYARITRLREAAASAPADASALCALGTALWWAGEHAEGLAVLERAVQADPCHPDGLTNLANALAALGRTAEAEARYRQVLRHRPNDPAVHFNIGCAHLADEDFEAAEASFRAAITLRPDYPQALNNLGSALRQQGRTHEALDCYRRAVALRPDVAGMHNNVGSALLALGRADQAMPELRTAVGQEPENAEFCNNLAGALLALDQATLAARWFRHAVRRDPQHCQARFGLALALLAQGEFREGWQAYESRWADPAFTEGELALPQPAWDGTEPVAGRTILLHAEQGLGDTLQFVRYAPLLRTRGARVVLQVAAPLVALLGDLAEIVVARGEALPPFDLHCPLMSLPRAFATELHSIPADIPYLRAPPGHVAAWSARLGAKRRARRQSKGRPLPPGRTAPFGGFASIKSQSATPS